MKVNSNQKKSKVSSVYIEFTKFISLEGCIEFILIFRGIALNIQSYKLQKFIKF